MRLRKLLLFSLIITIALLGTSSTMAKDDKSHPDRILRPVSAIIVVDQDDPTLTYGVQLLPPGTLLTPELKRQVIENITTAFPMPERMEINGKPLLDNLTTEAVMSQGAGCFRTLMSCAPGCARGDWTCCDLVGCGLRCADCQIIVVPAPFPKE